MYGRIGCHRAIAIAPETPNKATAQGPMQHNPMKDAIALMLIAPPVVAASRLSSRTCFSSAAAIAQLHRWAFDRSVGTKNAAITPLGSQQCSTSFAVVVELARIGRHRFHLAVAALGAGDGGLKGEFTRLARCCGGISHRKAIGGGYRQNPIAFWMGARFEAFVAAEASVSGSLVNMVV